MKRYYGYWEKPENIDAAFDGMVESLRRVPTRDEFGKKYRGALDKIRNGKYHEDVRGFNDYLRHGGFRINYDPERWKDPGKIDAAFDDLVETLRRVPTQKEFGDKYGGALTHITNKKYLPDVACFNDYLRHGGFRVNHNMGGWDDPKSIDAAFDEMVETLRMVPTRKELQKKYSGIFDNLKKGKYHPGVRGLNDYLRHWGFKVNHDLGRWKDPKSIDAAFDDMVETLRRVPRYKEFRGKYGGALQALHNGKYSPDVKNFNDYLRYWRFSACHERGRWGKPENVDEAFDDLVETLRRVPTYKEIQSKYSGMLWNMKLGRYHPQVNGLNDYLRFRGFKVNHDLGKGGRVLNILLRDKK